MDDQQADDLKPDRVGGEVRRRLLRGLAAGIAAVGLSRFGGEAAQRKKKKKPLCATCPKLCETPDTVLCRPSSNIEIESCVCARTTAGETICVNIAPNLGCSMTDQCQTDADCSAGAACIKVDSVNCCPPFPPDSPPPTGNLCKPICKQGK